MRVRLLSVSAVVQAAQQWYSCAPGRFIHGYDCVDCPGGKFQSQGDADSCYKGCHDGHEATGEGTVRVCTPCAVGQFGISFARAANIDGTTCKECPAGKYQDGGGQVDCHVCPSGATAAVQSAAKAGVGAAIPPSHAVT